MPHLEPRLRHLDADFLRLVRASNAGAVVGRQHIGTMSRCSGLAASSIGRPLRICNRRHISSPSTAAMTTWPSSAFSARSTRSTSPFEMPEPLMASPAPRITKSRLRMADHRLVQVDAPDGHVLTRRAEAGRCQALARRAFADVIGNDGCAVRKRLATDHGVTRCTAQSSLSFSLRDLQEGRHQRRCATAASWRTSANILNSGACRCSPSRRRQFCA